MTYEAQINAFAAHGPVKRVNASVHVTRCPYHGSKQWKLYLVRGQRGTVLSCKTRGCDPQDIAASAGLSMAQLFYDGPQRVDYSPERRCFRAAPVATVEAMLEREIDRQRQRRVQQRPCDTPLVRSADVNAARERVNAILGTTLAPVDRFEWECCAPHDQDPLWPACLQRAKDELFFTSDRFEIEDRAAQLLHEAARFDEAPRKVVAA